MCSKMWIATKTYIKPQKLKYDSSNVVRIVALKDVPFL